MTGTVGKLIKERKIFPTCEEGKEFVDQWLKKEDIRRCVYQGSASFEGNQCKKILLRADPSMVTAYREQGDEIYKKAEPFLNTLLEFQKVVKCCFGQELLYNAEGNPMHPELILSFMKSYRCLNITVPFKVHIIKDKL